MHFLKHVSTAHSVPVNEGIEATRQQGNVRGWHGFTAGWHGFTATNSRVAMIQLTALIAGSLLFAGCAGSQRGTEVLQDVPFETEDWRFGSHAGHRITSQHYDVYTTIQDELLRDSIPQAVETAFAFYRELVPTAREPEEPLKVYLFAQRGEWEAFTRQFAGPRAKTLLQVRHGGYSERGVSVIEYVAHSVTFPLLTHEGFHQFLHKCAVGRAPAWLHEGLATMCEGQRWSNVSLREFDPWHNPTRRNALAEALSRDKLIPLDELLRMNAGHVIGGDSRRINTYYAQAWALMLFLREAEEGKYAESFARLLATLGKEDLEPYARAAHVNSAETSYSFGLEVFRGFISDDIKSIEQEYQKFMRERIVEPKKKKWWG